MTAEEVSPQAMPTSEDPHPANSDCPFCSDDGRRIDGTNSWYAKLDQYPVSPGHTLFIPRRHMADMFDLTLDEVAELYRLMRHVSRYIKRKYQPDGFNIGVNDGAAAGRTVHHLHIHLIPRYTGDVPDPRGGVRNILPGPSPNLWSTPPRVNERVGREVNQG